MTDQETTDRSRVSIPHRIPAYLTGAVLLMAGAGMFFLAFPLLQGKLYLYNDLSQYHLPTRHFYAECLKNGDDFAWMPSLFCGFYLQGEGQAGMYHPFHFLLYRFLPLAPAFNIEFMASYLFMFAGTMLFLRRWRLPLFAVVFGAFTFTFSGFNLLHYIHINMVAVVAHIPWLLFATDAALHAKSRRAFGAACLGITALTASQLLCGFPQSVYYSLLAEGVYVACFVVDRLRSRKGSPADCIRPLAAKCAWIAAFKLLALLIAGVQLLASLDILSESTRANAGPEFKYYFSLHPANLLQLIGPYFFKAYIGMNADAPKHSHEAGMYLGALGLLFVVWTILRRKAWLRDATFTGDESTDRPLAPLYYAALTLAGLGLILALGKYTPVYPLLSQLPVLKAFRAPGRHIVLIHLAVSWLAAIAVTDLARPADTVDRRRWTSLWPLAVPLGVGWLAAAILLSARAGLFGGVFRTVLPNIVLELLASNTALLLSPAILTLATLLLMFVARTRNAFALTLLLVCAGTDQFFYTTRMLRQEHPRSLETFMRETVAPPPDLDYRAYGLVNDVITLHGISNATGYIGLGLRRELTCDYDHPTQLRAAGVHWQSNDWPDTGEPVTWHALHDPAPILRMASKTVVSAAPDSDIERIDLNDTALVTTPLELPVAKLGMATVLTYKPGLITARTNTVARQLLVVTESYHPGWRVTIDRAPQPVLRVNGDFMGCVVEPGSHEVTLRFQPDSLRIGKLVSLAGLALAGLAALYFVLPTRRSISASGASQ